SRWKKPAARRPDAHRRPACPPDGIFHGGRTMTGVAAAVLNSLDIGLLLFVILVGLNIVFVVLNIINFAHGALYMVGAYLGYTCINQWGMPFWLALVVAPLCVAALAVLIDRGMLRFIYHREVTDSLLLTFSLLLIINESVRQIW